MTSHLPFLNKSVPNPLHERSSLSGAISQVEKELKKQVRGIRPIEKSLEGKDDQESEAVRDYCLAVRAAITDDGHPPLCASGLKLHDRLSQITDSLEAVAQKRGNFPNHFCVCNIF